MIISQNKNDISVVSNTNVREQTSIHLSNLESATK